MEHDENVTPDVSAEETALPPETGEALPPVEETPVEETPVEETPVEEVPTEEAPGEEVPTEETPVEEAPGEEVPTEEAPAEEIPTEEAPGEEIPTEEAPAEQPDKKGKGKGKKRKGFHFPSWKKGGASLIVYSVVLAACLIFFAVSGIFTGIGETFALAFNAREEIGAFIEAIKNGDGDLLGGALGGIGGALGGGGEAHEPDKIYDVGTLLQTAFDERSETVSVAHLNLTSDELREGVEHFLFTNPRYFFVSTSYAVVYKQGSDQVMSARFTYLYDETATLNMQAELDAAVQEIVAGAPEGGNDFDDVLYFHDYLVKHYAYDYRDLPENERIRDAYHFFTERTGVCQAYMQAMTLLCHARGIESIPVVSEEMDHAWNLIKVDGSWYHVDVTWDDAGGETAPVYPSYSSYRYFLLSDDAVKAAGHTGYRTWESATDTTYDNAIWRGTRTPMVRLGDKYYASYYKVDGVLGDPNDPHGTEILCGTLRDMQMVRDLGGICWYESESSCYQTAFLSLVAKDGVLYFNTNTALYCYDPNADEMHMVKDLTASLGGRQIFGIAALEGNTFSLVTAIAPKGEYTVLKTTVSN